MMPSWLDHDRAHGPAASCRRAHWLVHWVVAVAIAAATGVPQRANAQRTAPPIIRESVHRAVAAVGASLRLGLDPSAVEELTASATIFAGNFCTGQNEAVAGAKCEASLFRESVLRRHVRDYLADAASGQAEVKPSEPGSRKRSVVASRRSVGRRTSQTNSVWSSCLPS